MIRLNLKLTFFTKFSKINVYRYKTLLFKIEVEELAHKEWTAFNYCWPFLLLI